MALRLSGTWWEEASLVIEWDALSEALLVEPLVQSSEVLLAQSWWESSLVPLSWESLSPPLSVSHTLPITPTNQTHSDHESTSQSLKHLPVTPSPPLLIALTSYVNENALLLNTNPLSSNEEMSTYHIHSSPSLSTSTEPK